MDDEIAGCFWTVVIAIAAVVFWIWGWDSALRYSIQYTVDLDNVTVETKPKDCDFMHAPLGQKDCHYEKVVTVWRFTRFGSGGPVVSVNGGQWQPNEGGPVTGGRVHVEWAKKTP